MYCPYVIEEQPDDQKNTIAGRMTIEPHRKMIVDDGNDDPTTRSLSAESWSMEVEHTEDLLSLLKAFGSESHSSRTSG